DHAIAPPAVNRVRRRVRRSFWPFTITLPEASTATWSPSRTSGDTTDHSAAPFEPDSLTTARAVAQGLLVPRHTVPATRASPFAYSASALATLDTAAGSSSIASHASAPDVPENLATTPFPARVA